MVVVVEEGGRQAILLDGKESEETSGGDLAYGRRTAAVGTLDPEAAVPSFPRHVERVGKLDSVSRERASMLAYCLAREVRGGREVEGVYLPV
jgi:hypothetical protein